MSRSPEIRSQIRAFVLQQFPLAARMSLADEDSLVGSGIIDSMGILELVTFIESEFSLVLTDEEVASDNFDSIIALADFVAGKVDTSSQLSADD